MPAFSESKTVTVTIERDVDEVYAFVSQPENLPLWAKAFCRSIVRDGEDWIVQMPSGQVGLRFAGPNPFRVCDHTVVVAPGLEIYIPMRIVRNGTGAEVLFTVFRQPGITPESFAHDLATLKRDLDTLKQHLEQRA